MICGVTLRVISGVISGDMEGDMGVDMGGDMRVKSGVIWGLICLGHHLRHVWGSLIYPWCYMHL